ncbi:MAG: hypothetical protein L0H64_04195 [Pseudonocardia sp.]|nr:hypothetical protein [Pseudonocardia sp.]
MAPARASSVRYAEIVDPPTGSGAGQRGDHRLDGVVEPDRAVTGGQDLLEIAERVGQLVGDRGQRDRRVGRLSE